MRLLLDTHVLLWSVLDDPALPRRFREALEAPGAEVYVSAVTVWEVSIKRSLGKLPVPGDLFDRALQAGCIPLPVAWAHARAVEALPPHHADPFDRMLVAQAQVEGLTIVTADPAFWHYGVSLL